MKLDQYLGSNPDERPTFHKRIRVTPMALGRYCRGERTPVGPVMIRIFVESDGQVQPNDFYDLPPLRNGAAKRKAAAA